MSDVDAKKKKKKRHQQAVLPQQHGHRTSVGSGNGHRSQHRGSYHLEQEESSEEEAGERHRLGEAEHIQKYPKVLLGFAVSKHSLWDKPSDFPEVDSTHHACTAGHVQSHSSYLDPQAGMNNPAPELPHLIFRRTTG